MRYDNNNTDRSDYRIAPVDELDDWKIHDDDTDIRGWDVYTSSGKKIGEINTLIADTGLQKVRYAEIELEEDLDDRRNFKYRDSLSASDRVYYGEDDDRYTIVPIGMLYVDHDDDQVIASGNLTELNFADSPRYSGIESSRVTPPYELLVVRYYSDLDNNYKNTYSEDRYRMDDYRNATSISDDEFYETDFFDPERYRHRYGQPDRQRAEVNPA